MLVNANLAELALQFPAGEAAALARVIASLDARFGVLDPAGVGRLCRHLAAGGRPTDALVLTEALLTRLPGSRGSRAVMDTWSFAEVLRTSVPAVARACGPPAVSLLARVLDETVTAQTPASLREARRDTSGGDESGWNFRIDSDIWRFRNAQDLADLARIRQECCSRR